MTALPFSRPRPGMVLGTVLATVLFCFTGSVARSEQLTLEPGSHICLIGNTLAERMQHDGWLETHLHLRFPQHQLVIRNLGYSGDELTLRLRSAGFGSPDEHLTKNKADVVIAMFGFNESFAGAEGLPKFTADLEAFIKHTLAQQYNGRTPPQLVICSPIAHEDLADPNLPDGRENNERLALYTDAMRKVAAQHGVPFVDLFAASQEAYQASAEPLTINGVHLNEAGNRRVAEAIATALFGPAPEKDAPEIERLRQAVLDKNFYWFNRYRTVDGYSIYGGRADLAFVDGQTNREVMQREMEVLDVMTANRDERIWAVAQGGDREVRDDNTPPFLEVKTNKPGDGPNGTHLFLDGEEAIRQMTVHSGMQVNLFASEKEFPELANPVQIAFDTRGRLWVAVMPSYPHWKPDEPMNDKILILEDTDGDGRADVCKTFADGLHVPTGLEFWGGGLFVGAQPDLLFLQDLDGDDKADVRTRVLHGIDSADTHHALNSFVLDPGGALYFQEGTFHHTQVETPYGVQRCANAGVFRFEPRTHKFDVYVSYGFANPHGHVFDRWGQDFVTDGTGNVNYYAAAFSGHIEFPHKHNSVRPFFQQRTRPCPGTEILSSRHFPDHLQGNYLVGNVIGFQGILQYKFRDDGSGFGADEVEPIVHSSDPNFRPTDMEIGPDGAIYFSEWQNPIIGHMQHNLRDPSRDRTHGRIYRVTYPSRPLLTPAKIAGQPIPELLELLKEPEDRVRYRAKIELGARPTDEVTRELAAWVARLDPEDEHYEHHLLEALWVHQYHNVVHLELLERMLTSPDFRARAAATRVLCYWRDRVPNALDRLKQLAGDEHPRVRLEAVRAASFFREPEAIEIPLISAEYPTDYFLDYTRAETMRTLEPHWQKALAEGRRIHVTSDVGMRFLLSKMRTEEILKLPRTRAVDLELLTRPGLFDEQRQQAAEGLAEAEKRSVVEVLLEAIRAQQQSGARDESVVYDLVRLLASRSPAELAAVRQQLEAMATRGTSAAIRQIGWVTMIMADGTADSAWQLASQSAATLHDFLRAIPLIPDPARKASLFDRAHALLEGLPESLAASDVASGTFGRFVRIELPRRGTLTLAEVEIYSGGRNVARRGTATQKNTSHGGVASRAIDGNTSGKYGQGGQTHTEENTDQPWWEVDLLEEVPIESIVIYNRDEDSLGERLAGFTLKVLDSGRREVFAQSDLPAPTPRSEFTLGGHGTQSLVRRAAMFALVSVRGKEEASFRAIAPFIRDENERHSAMQALLRIPTAHWPTDQATELLPTVTEYLANLPASDRTSPAALDALQLGYSIAALLPAEQAQAARRTLGQLGVQVIRVGTRPHQMLFDQDRLVIQAGKRVEFIFENTDIMPHNFVIVQPGSLEEIGMLAESTATHPDALDRQYVPVSGKVLLASNLLQPRAAQKLAFEAPSQPGVYPYVCTYPGHWRRMFGALYVVDDLEQYLADPDAYLASHDLPIHDELLKLKRARKEWKLEDLAASVQSLDGGRSFATGKQMFEVANCSACHRMNGVGQAIGPDLTQLDPKWKAIDILKEILDPSANINEKFQSYVIETEDGRVVTGLVVEESDSELKVLENPLAKTEPLVLRKSDIAERQKSPNSIMPRGLLDTLSHEEILDLVAYIAARGAQDSALFSEHAEHDH